jgi:hypothetical protein
MPGTSGGVRGRIDFDVGEQELWQQMGNLGAAIGKIGQAFQDVRDNRDIAKGIADYNNIINEYNESLPGKDPKDYERGFTELKPRIDAITADMSGRAKQDLTNRFAIWNETNRAKISLLSMKATAAMTKQELPLRLKQFARAKQDQFANDYIDSLDTIIGPAERKLWKEQYIEYKRENLIFDAINLAADNPTPENLADARKIIELESKTSEEEYYHLQKLRAREANSNRLKDLAYQAQLSKQAQEMVQVFSSGMVFEGEVLPELQPIYSQFAERTANNSMDVGDGVTYDAIKARINAGYYVDPFDLISAYSSGLSTQQYQELAKENDKNAKLTPVQKEEMEKYNVYVNTKYATLRSLVSAKIPLTAKPDVYSAIDMDAEALEDEVRNAVLSGKPSNEIYSEIEAHFLADTDNLVQGWWGRMFSRRSQELTDEVYSRGERTDRYDIIMQLMKSDDEKDRERLRGLLVKWYK